MPPKDFNPNDFRERPGAIPPVQDGILPRPEALAALLPMVRRHGLVSLVGAPGTGKSELVMAAGRALQAERTDLRVLYQELGPDFGPARLRAFLALAMAVQRPPASDGELAGALARRPTLLILDRAENMTAGAADQAQFAAQLDAWLAAAPELHVLVAATRPIGATRRAEHLLFMPPLDRAGTEALLPCAPPARRDWSRLLDLVAGRPLAALLLAPVLEEDADALPRIVATLERGLASAEALPPLDAAAPAGEGGADEKLLAASLDVAFGALEARRPEAAAAFLRLGEFPAGLPEAVAAAVIAAGAGRLPVSSREALDELYRRRLLERRGPRCFHPPALAKAIGCLRLRYVDRPGPWLNAALAAYADYVDRLDEGFRRDQHPAWLQGWLQEEETLLRLAENGARPAANDWGSASSLARIAACAQGLLNFSSRLDAWHRLAAAGLANARRSRDRLGEANTLKALGDLCRRRGQPQEAASAYQQALHIYRQGKEVLGEAHALKALGDLQAELGRDGHADDTYRQALRAYRSIGFRVGEADTLTALGDLCQRCNQPEEAGNAYRQALPICRELGNPLCTANILRTLGDLCLRQARPDEADAAYRQALPLYRQTHDPLGEAATLKILGDAALARSLPEEADAAYRAAVSVSRRASDMPGEAGALKALGDLCLGRERFEEAEAALNQALPLFRGMKDAAGEAGALTALGDLYRHGSRLDEADRAYQQALPLFRESGDALGEGSALKSLGDLYLRRARLDPADEAYRQALALFRQENERAGEARTLSALGELCRHRFQLDGAELAYRQALPLYREIRDRLGEANTLTALGELARARSELDQADGAYRQALPLYREGGDLRGEANTLRALGDISLRRADLDEAEKALQQALPLYREIRDRLGEANTLTALGDLWLRRDNLDEADAFYREALAIYRDIGDGRVIPTPRPP